ncbi:Hypp3074 [Branchiostoma lanceolatum]|uniref:Hypp3074 protein n=1 Tax=Branchiostoma lanceolatum TaxID=7740 RepID=A0A8K0EW59_BRALA|nr:Hypp3074 [Branchiostoma lanceolatum]
MLCWVTEIELFGLYLVQRYTWDELYPIIYLWAERVLGWVKSDDPLVGRRAVRKWSRTHNGTELQQIVTIFALNNGFVRQATTQGFYEVLMVSVNCHHHRSY